MQKVLIGKSWIKGAGETKCFLTFFGLFFLKLRDAFQKNDRIKDFVPSRVHPPTLPTTWETFFWEYIHDQRTHPPMTYLGIFAIKLGLFNSNPEKNQNIKFEK